MVVFPNTHKYGDIQSKTLNDGKLVVGGGGGGS